MVQTLTGMPVVVLGSSSQIGWFLVPRLVSVGFRVIAVSRTGRPKGYPDFPQVKWTIPDELPDVGKEAALLVSAGPMQLAINALDDLPLLRRLVVFSTTSVLSKIESPDPDERAVVVEIARMEAVLRERCVDRKISLSLFRPTLIYGAGMDANVSRLARLMHKTPLFPVAGSARGLRQPVHADDLASVAVKALLSNAALPEELNLCGGSTLTYLEMLEKIAGASGRRLRVFHLPRGIMTLGLRLFGRALGLEDISPAMILRQDQDLVFDDSAAREILAYDPRPFQPRPEDFDLPEKNRILSLAGLNTSGGS